MKAQNRWEQPGIDTDKKDKPQGVEGPAQGAGTDETASATIDKKMALPHLVFKKKAS